MAENEFTIYDLLDKIRPKPVLYLGELSITRLSMYVEGYQSALIDRGLREVTSPSFRDFHFWARARLGQDRKTIGWPGSILEACRGDEVQALNRFYAMLDEYRGGLFPDLVEQHLHG